MQAGLGFFFRKQQQLDGIATYVVSCPYVCVRELQGRENKAGILFFQALEKKNSRSAVGTLMTCLVQAGFLDVCISSVL